MANVAFPTIPISSWQLSLVFPGQVVHEAIYTADRQVISRGIGRYEGSLTFPPFETKTDEGRASRRQLEVFLALTEGAANTFDIIVPNLAQQNRFTNLQQALSVTAIARSGSTMTLTFSVAVGLLFGDYITIDNKLFQLLTPMQSNTAIVSPYRQLPTTQNNKNIISPAVSVNWSVPTIRARRVNAEAIPIITDPDFVSPITIEFVGVQ